MDTTLSQQISESNELECSTERIPGTFCYIQNKTKLFVCSRNDVIKVVVEREFLVKPNAQITDTLYSLKRCTR